MMIKQSVLPITVIVSISLLLTACGGGGGSSSTKVLHTYDGTWKRTCNYDATKSKADQAIITIKGNDMMVDYKRYATQNCTGATDLLANATFDIQYKGEQATGVCKAEKVDIKITALSINKTKIPTNNIQGLLTRFNSLSSPQYDLLCIDEKGFLRSGDTSDAKHDASAPDKRPIAMDMSEEKKGVKQ